MTGVTSARYTSLGCGVTNFTPGFSEFRVFGAAAVTTPAFGLARRFQALAGRQAHSTPLVVNLTDDNFDDVIDARDIPDIVVPVETVGNRLKGEIKVVSGDDGLSWAEPVVQVRKPDGQHILYGHVTPDKAAAFAATRQPSSALRARASSSGENLALKLPARVPAVTSRVLSRSRERAFAPGSF